MTRIGEWVVDPHHNELRRKGESIRLEPKVIEVFMQLAARPGTAVSRDELLAAVWPGVIVGDDALTQAIIKLRKALGDDAHKPTYIETISKRGYRLIAPVEPDCAEGAPKAGAASPRRAAILVLAIAAAGLVIALAVVSARMPWPLAPDTKGAASASIPIVAVLPLENLSGDAKRDYLTDGITEDIINGLGRFSGVRVMSRNAVQALRGEAATMKAIRAEIPARYVVQGSVREADGLLRVAIELSHVERAEQLWSERYEGAGARLFEIQDRIVRDIVGKLQVRLTQIEAQRAFAKPTGNLEAHDLLLRARFLLKRNERGAGAARPRRTARTRLSGDLRGLRPRGIPARDRRLDRGRRGGYAPRGGAREARALDR
jgi:adenylate cyclase